MSDGPSSIGLDVAPASGRSSGDQLRKPWIETPLIESRALSEIAGCRVYLKLENLQPSGSFKSRNVGNFILQHILSTPRHLRSSLHFYTSSGGNAGLGAVIAAKSLGYPCSVVVPLSTKPMMIEKLRKAGAQEVVQKGATWRDADNFLRKEILHEGDDSTGSKEEANEEKGVYVPPFDHLMVWEASALIPEEVERQIHDLEVDPSLQNPGGRIGPEAIICSVGGGGLFAGISLGLERSALSSQKTKVIASETEGADSLYQSIRAGERVTLPGITSIATSLGAVQVCEKAFAYGRQKDKVASVKVTDKAAVEALIRFADDERILVEPACGAALAVIYSSGVLDGAVREVMGREVRKEDRVVVVVCGGSNISLELIEEWKKTYGIQE